MTEWAADALIPSDIWYAGWHDVPAPRTLRIGAQQVEAPDASTRDGASGFARLMALVMTERSAGDGACTEADLGAAGFTASEIALHADRARELARQRTATRDGVAGRRHRVTSLKPVWPVFRVPARREVRP